MKTITTRNNIAVLQPLILGQHGGATCRPDSEPCPTIATGGAIRKIEAFVIDMSRPGGTDSGHIRPSKEPMRTITTYDNVQGVFPVLEDGRVIDIRIRMLKPSELAAAHSFPKDYMLSGSRADQVKQIGNSVPVRTAKAISKAIFGKAA
jgi:DNA (cytosine-5)-methyltransferase 1